VTSLRTGTPADIGGNPAPGGSHEFQHRPGRPAREFPLRIGHSGWEVLSAAEQRVVKPFEFQPFVGWETRSPQTDDVQTANLVRPRRDGERWQVFAERRAALHHRQRADAAELMHEAIAGNERAVLHDHVPRQHSAAPDDHVVANHGVVPDVTLWRQQVVRTNDRVLRQGVRAIQGDVLAKDIMLADAQPRWRATKFQIHWRIADDTARVEVVVRANRRGTGEVNVRPDDAVRADFHPFIDHSVRTDANGGIQPGFRMNHGSWMDHGS